MDEYDVFLDEMSRKITLDQLISYTKSASQKDRQFIVITPNNLKDVITTKQVKVVKMKDPKVVSAHGLQQTTID